MKSSTSHEIDGDELRLHFAHRSSAERMGEELDDPRGRRSVEEAVATAYGVQLKVKALHGSGEDEADRKPVDHSDSPLVRAAMAMGARIIDDSSADGGSS